MEKREKIIKIRVSESEYEELVLRSSKPKLAQWMREFCLDAKVPRANKIPKIDPSLLRQIAAIGNNLNQIARHMNVEKRQPIDRFHLLLHWPVSKDSFLLSKRNTPVIVKVHSTGAGRGSGPVGCLLEKDLKREGVFYFFLTPSSASFSWVSLGLVCV